MHWSSLEACTIWVANLFWYTIKQTVAVLPFFLKNKDNHQKTHLSNNSGYSQEWAYYIFGKCYIIL